MVGIPPDVMEVNYLVVGIPPDAMEVNYLVVGIHPDPMLGILAVHIPLSAKVGITDRW